MLVEVLAVPAPPALNVNFASFVWPPVAGVYGSRGTFWAALFGATGLLLVLGELLIRRLAGAGDRAPGARPAQL